MAFTTLRLILLIIIIFKVQSRVLHLHPSDNNLVSDGNERVKDQLSSLSAENNGPSLLKTCKHQYGFLPCAENAAGYVFQILVYQGLLVYGGNLIGRGSKVLFDIMGVGKVGGIIFRILMSLPSMILVIASGVFGSKETAQSMVSVGVGTYAGVTVFSLTLHWALCVIYGKKDLLHNGTSSDTAETNSNWYSTGKTLLVLKDTGVSIDEQTQITAGIMLLSLFPYIIVQLNGVFNTPDEIRIVTLIALIVSSFSLISYFMYQIWNPWIQERSLKYSKHELLRTEFMNHVERQWQLVNEDGKLNTDAVKKLFDDVDKDDDSNVTNVEMEKLVREIIGNGKLKVDKEFAVTEIMKSFDLNDNRCVTEEEFIDGYKKWIDETQQTSENSDFSRNAFDEILNLFKQNNENGPQKKELVMSKILKHAETEILKAQSLVTPDGKPNDEQIKTLFRQFNPDGDKAISRSELEQLLKTVNFGESQLNYEDAVQDLFKDFDTNNSNVIDESEFAGGLKKWVNKAINVAQTLDKTKAIEKYHEMVWKPRKYNLWDFFRSVFDILFGIVIVTFLGGPLMNSIRQLSYALNLSSFCISFVIVPLATNAKIALKAMVPAKQKSDLLASLTFSEIYSVVIMQNVAGMTTLLAIVHAKELTFDFSAEVLTILVVCGIIGTLAYSRRSYPLWTCVLALFLYPCSLGLYYFSSFILNWK